MILKGLIDLIHKLIEIVAKLISSFLLVFWLWIPATLIIIYLIGCWVAGANVAENINGLYATLIIGLVIAGFTFVKKGKGKNLMTNKSNNESQNSSNQYPSNPYMPTIQQTGQIGQPQPIYNIINPPMMSPNGLQQLYSPNQLPSTPVYHQPTTQTDIQSATVHSQDLSQSQNIIHPSLQPMHPSLQSSLVSQPQSPMPSINAYNTTQPNQNSVATLLSSNQNQRATFNNTISIDTPMTIDNQSTHLQYPLIFASRRDPDLFIEELQDRLMYYRRNGRNLYCEGIMWKENSLQQE